MRHTLWIAAIAPALLMGACKKNKEVEAAAEPAPPPPAIEIAWDEATFSGSRAEGNTGNLKIGMSIKNQSGTGLVLDMLALNVMGASMDKACMYKDAVAGKAMDGDSINVSVEVDCAYKKLPSSGDLSVSGMLMYRIGNADMKQALDQTVSFSR